MDRLRVGTTMRTLRGNRTLQEMAEKIGVSVSALTMYELGERTPRDDVKIQIAKCYGVSVGDLFFPSTSTQSEDEETES